EAGLIRMASPSECLMITGVPGWFASAFLDDLAGTPLAGFEEIRALVHPETSPPVACLRERHPVLGGFVACDLTALGVGRSSHEPMRTTEDEKLGGAGPLGRAGLPGVARRSPGVTRAGQGAGCGPGGPPHEAFDGSLDAAGKSARATLASTVGRGSTWHTLS